MANFRFSKEKTKTVTYVEPILLHDKVSGFEKIFYFHTDRVLQQEITITLLRAYVFDIYTPKIHISKYMVL